MSERTERVEYWVRRKWRTDKEFKDTYQHDTPDLVIRRRDIENETNEHAEHIAVKRTIVEEVL